MHLFTQLERIISSQGSTGESQAGILAEIGAPTVSIAILDHDTIESECISTIGGDSETLFQACSISKPIAGMATMRLIQQGRLRLDDKIVQLLPKHISRILETPQTKSLLQQITVKHLMSHTSGLSIHGFPGYPDNPPDVDVVLSGKAPANTLHVRLEGLPGHTFAYSGGGMTVLQMILETVTGKDFQSIAHELVFEPLQMTRSFYTLPKAETNVAKAYFTGYAPCHNDWHFQPEQAAAGLWTTPTDLLKAMRAMQKSLRNSSSEPFLEKEIAEQMISEISNGMGLTWFAPRDPGNVLAHGGSNDPGWECFLLGYADVRAQSTRGDNQLFNQDSWIGDGICIMTNSASGKLVYSKVFHAISYLRGWPQIPDLYGSGPFGKIPFCAYDATVDGRWVDWKGCWTDHESEFFLEADGNGGPILRYGHDVKIRLVPAAMPRITYPEGKGESIDLVLEGLEMMVRLGWREGKIAGELWQSRKISQIHHVSDSS